MSDTEEQIQRKKLEQDIFGDEEEGLSDLEDQGDAVPSDDEGGFQRFTLPDGDGDDDEIEVSLPRFRKRGDGGQKVRKPRTRKAPAPQPVEEEEPEDPEKRRQWQLNKTIDAALKQGKKKRKKMDGDDLASFHDDEMHRLREQMKQAAFIDIDARKDGRPATNKLKMLPQVEELLNRSSLADSILESNILEAVRLWLEPLPDKSLPALNIQKALFTILDKLPITSDHLRESGVGKIVFFYTLPNKRVETSIARLADNLVSTWSRPIIKKSKSYRDRDIIEVDYIGREDLVNGDFPGRPSLNQPAESDPHMRRKYAHHARIPQAVQAAYTIAPRTNVAAQALSANFGPGSAGKDHRYKHITKRLTASKNKGTGLKSRVSIQGT